MSKPERVCVLSDDETEAFQKHGIEPVHSQHWHMKKAEAAELIPEAKGTQSSRPEARAEWVGPRHIRLLSTYAVRGLSARFGEPIAIALASRQPWAGTMLSDMQRK